MTKHPEFDIQLETQKSCVLQMVGLIESGILGLTTPQFPKDPFIQPGVPMETTLHWGAPSSERSVLHHSSQSISQYVSVCV